MKEEKPKKKVEGSDIMEALLKEDYKGEDLEKLLDYLFQEQGIEKKTELNQHQINTLSTYYWLADEYQIPSLERYIKTFLNFMLSKDRKSRKEILDFFQQYRYEENSFNSSTDESRERNAKRKLGDMW